jgi:hypothetical protein
MVKSIDDIKGVQLVPIRKNSGKVIFHLSETVTIEVPNRGIRCFSKRAILRIAMLLRDSKIAQEIRTQLLNTFEHSTNEQRTVDIDEKPQLVKKDNESILYKNMPQNSVFLFLIALKPLVYKDFLKIL